MHEISRFRPARNESSRHLDLGHSRSFLRQNHKDTLDASLYRRRRGDATYLCSQRRQMSRLLFFFPSSTIAASRSIKSIREENAGENCTLSFEGRVRGTCGVTVYPREIIFPRRESATRLSNELQNSTRDIASTLFTIGELLFLPSSGNGRHERRMPTLR